MVWVVVVVAMAMAAAEKVVVARGWVVAWVGAWAMGMEGEVVAEVARVRVAGVRVVARVGRGMVEVEAMGALVLVGMAWVVARILAEGVASWVVMVA